MHLNHINWSMCTCASQLSGRGGRTLSCIVLIIDSGNRIEWYFQLVETKTGLTAALPMSTKPCTQRCLLNYLGFFSLQNIAVITYDNKAELREQVNAKLCFCWFQELFLRTAPCPRSHSVSHLNKQSHHCLRIHSVEWNEMKLRIKWGIHHLCHRAARSSQA